MDLKTIESKYNITYPDIYHRLNQDKMLDWGEFGQNWIGEVYPKLKQEPPLLLYANEFEIADFDNIILDIESLRKPSYRPVDPKFDFVPFAYTYAGDMYCFDFNATKEGNVPIMLVWHDMNFAQVLAKNFQDFIFRAMIEAIIEFENDHSLLSEGDINDNLNNFLRTHEKYLRDSHREVVQKWYEHSIKVAKSKGSLLSDKEIETVLKEMKTLIAFEHLDKELEYEKEN